MTSALGSMRTTLVRRWPMLVALIVMWNALWGNVSIANILGGAIVATAVLAFAATVQPRPVHSFNVGAAWRYLKTFAVQLTIASWDVARAVLRPDRIKPGIIATPLHHASDAVVTLVANSITLTPGTLTLETESRDDVTILYVHALNLADADAVREDVCELEVLAVDAFAGPDAQALQARTLEELEDGQDDVTPPPTDTDADGAARSADPAADTPTDADGAGAARSADPAADTPTDADAAGAARSADPAAGTPTDADGAGAARSADPADASSNTDGVDEGKDRQ